MSPRTVAVVDRCPVCWPVRDWDGRHVNFALIAWVSLGLLLWTRAFADDRTSSTSQKESTAQLIQLLGHKQFPARERAAKLLSDRPDALPELKEAIKGTDPEIRRRAAQIIPVLEKAARQAEIERLCGGIGNNRLDRLAHLIVEDGEKATEKQWTALIEVAHAITLRASELNQREYEKITDLFLTAIRREKPSEPRIEWRRTIRGTKSPIQQFGRGILLSNGDIDTIGSVSGAVILVDGDVKRCSGVHKSLIICTGSILKAGNILDSIVIAANRVELQGASGSCLFTRTINQDFDRPRNGGVFVGTPAMLEIEVYFGPKDIGLETKETESGLVVRTVLSNSTAERAGVKNDDRILTIDNVVVRTIRECRNALIGKRSGKTVQIEFERQGDRRRTDLVMP